MSNEVLRLAVAILAVIVAGASLVTAVRYGWSAWRIGRAPGRILARHVAEVALGTTGLVIGYASAIGEQQLEARVTIPPNVRTYIYLVSMLLLLAGLIEISVYQSARARNHPARQAQVRDVVRAAMEGQPVSGPRSADRVSVLAANAVLELEGTPTLPVPERPARNGDTSPASTVSATGYGRHALTRDRRVR